MLESARAAGVGVGGWPGSDPPTLTSPHSPPPHAHAHTFPWRGCGRGRQSLAGAQTPSSSSGCGRGWRGGREGCQSLLQRPACQQRRAQPVCEWGMGGEWGGVEGVNVCCNGQHAGPTHAHAPCPHLVREGQAHAAGVAVRPLCQVVNLQGWDGSVGGVGGWVGAQPWQQQLEHVRSPLVPTAHSPSTTAATRTRTRPPATRAHTHARLAPHTPAGPRSRCRCPAPR